MDKKIKNLEKAAERIKKAALNKERIIIYADSDCDGICSAVILREALKNLPFDVAQGEGANLVAVAFPNREEDGYGINLKALEFLKSHAPALFITLDLGISNIKEVQMANELGFEVVIIDHHQILEKIPDAKVVVDPQQAGDESDTKYLCNAGITFKLAQELLGPAMSESLKKSMLEVAALATISDMVPQIKENVDIIQEGVRSLSNTLRPGLAAFLKLLPAAEAQTHMKIIGCINAAESADFKNEAYNLLTASDPQACHDLAENLLGRVRQKQMRIESIVQEVERRISATPDSRIIFEGDPAWKLILAGPVASMIAQKYGKPTFIYKKMDTESAGSVRSLKEGENSVAAMASCKDILITYGGHPKASGFRVSNKHLEDFKQRLMEYFLKPEA